MTEADAIKTIKQADAQVWDLQEAARFILGKYSALKETYKAREHLLFEAKETLRDIVKTAMVGSH